MELFRFFLQLNKIVYLLDILLKYSHCKDCLHLTLSQSKVKHSFIFPLVSVLELARLLALLLIRGFAFLQRQLC